MNLAGIEKQGIPNSRFQYNQGTGDKNFQGEEGKSFKIERDKDFGLNWDMTYDYQLCRFNQVDPLAEVAPQESLSPYQYSFNNPVRYNDPYGDCPWCLKALGDFVVGATVEYATQVAGNVVKDVLVNDVSFGDAITNSDNYTDVDVGDVLISGGTNTLTGGSGVLDKIKKVVNVVQDAKSAKRLETGIEVGSEVVKASVDAKTSGVEIAGINKDGTEVLADVITSGTNIGVNKSLSASAETARATVDGVEQLTDVSSKVINAGNDISKTAIVGGINKEKDLEK